MRLKDPTAWMEDLTVFVDDEEVAETAALLEPDLVYRGSKIAAAAWLSIVGIAAGGLAAVTLSSGILESALAFAAYLVVAAAMFAGLAPLTRRLVGGPIVWLAKTTFFWSALLAFAAVLSAAVTSAWLAYGLSTGAGFLIATVHGSIAPNSVKKEDAWLGASIASGVIGTLTATALDRTLGSAVPAAAIVGAVAGGVFAVPMSCLLMRFWDEAHAYVQMAKLFLHNDNFAPRAASYLDKALALAPADPLLLNLRGIAYSKMDQPERAAADWRRVAELRPQDVDPHLNLAVDCLRRGETGAALEALNAALALDPESASVHDHMGTVLEAAGELDRAIDHYDRAIAIDPHHAPAYSNRAHALLRKGEDAEALGDCERALAVDPGFLAALVNRGHALRALGQGDAAAESYRSALEEQLSPALREEALRGLEALEEGRPRAAA